MTTIDPSRVAAALRRQVSSLGGPARAVGTGGATRTRGTGNPGSAATNAAGAEDVASIVARRVQALDRDDPDRHRKAFRVFLESVLLAQFGPELVNDAGFHRLVDDVQSEMQADRELAVQIRGAAEALLGERS